MNAFGIGVIELNIQDIEQSEVLYLARRNQTLDWATVDRLVDINPDFRDFIDNVTRSAQIKDVHGRYDEPIGPDHYGDYLRKCGFPVSE